MRTNSGQLRFNLTCSKAENLKIFNEEKKKTPPGEHAIVFLLQSTTDGQEQDGSVLPLHMQQKRKKVRDTAVVVGVVPARV